MTSSRGALHIDWRLPDNFRMRTEHLDLIPTSPQLAGADWLERAALALHVGAPVPAEWPPTLVTDPSAPDGAGWWDWYVVKRDAEGAVLIGMMGIKGWPDVSQEVQIGCAFLPEFQRRGFGTEAVEALTSWALEQPNVRCVVAETPLENAGAATVLRKLGFVPATSDEPSLLRFSTSR